MSFKIFAYSMIVLLLNISAFTTGTNRAAELAEDATISAGGRGVGDMFDALVARIAASNIASTDSIVNDVDKCELGGTAVVVRGDEQIAAVAKHASGLISVAADRCVLRIEQIIQKLAARLAGTAGSAVALADTQIKLASVEINAITGRTASEAQLIASSALATVERAIHSAAELSVAIAQSDTSAIKAITGVAAERAKRLAESLAGRVSVVSMS